MCFVPEDSKLGENRTFHVEEMISEYCLCLDPGVLCSTSCCHLGPTPQAGCSPWPCLPSKPGPHSSRLHSAAYKHRCAVTHLPSCIQRHRRPLGYVVPWLHFPYPVHLVNSLECWLIVCGFPQPGSPFMLVKVTWRSMAKCFELSSFLLAGETLLTQQAVLCVTLVCPLSVS